MRRKPGHPPAAERRRAALGGRWRASVDGLRQDLRQALRQSLRQPLSTALVVGILAIGIGGTVAIYSVLAGVVLRPLPYPEQDRLVAVWERPAHEHWRQPFSWPDYLDLREGSRSFAEVGVIHPTWMNVGARDPGRLAGATCTASALRALGVMPRYGRLFTEGDEDGDPVVLLSDDLWRQRFGADPDAVGRTLVVDTVPREVIGVMPPDFELPSPWGGRDETKLWLPHVAVEDDVNRDQHWLPVVARLASGVSVTQAEGELESVATALAAEYPATNAQTRMWLEPLMERALGGVRHTLSILLGAVALVLTAACANVAGMLLARGTRRRAELAVRASLGAARSRLVRQLLVEGLVLAVTGGVAGIAVAAAGLEALRGIFPADLPRVGGIVIDGGALWLALALSLGSCLLFGLLPALRTADLELSSELRGAARGALGGGSRQRSLHRLVAVQLALGFVLVNSALLLGASYHRAVSQPVGFDRETVVARPALTGPAYEEPTAVIAFWQRLIDSVAAGPGVEAAAVTTKLPLLGGTNGWIRLGDEPFDPERRGPLVEYSAVSPAYARAMGIPLRAGRFLEARDLVAAAEVAGQDPLPIELPVVVNETFVRTFFPGREGPALGERFQSDSEPAHWRARIVGVVGDVRQWGLEQTPIPEAYFPFTANPWTDSALVVRGGGGWAPVAALVRETLGALDPSIPPPKVQTMDELLLARAGRRRFSTVLVACFAGTALLLVVTGTFGVLSYTLSRRRHEMGLRMALGADRWRVFRHALAQGGRLLGSGLVIGAVGVLGTAKVLAGLVYGVSPVSPLHTLGTAVGLTLVVLAAIAGPVVRATRVDPVIALRAD